MQLTHALDCFAFGQGGGGSIDDQYRSLRTHVKVLDPDSEEYEDIVADVSRGPVAASACLTLMTLLTTQLPDHGLRVHNIYALSRHVDSDAFDYSVAPQRRLFHGTSLKNLRGILLRGLLMPEVHLFHPLHPPLAHRPLTLHPLVQVVTSRLRVDRSDGGLLGSGLYFSPDAAMSARYAHAGRSTAAAGRRIMFVARVASGREYPCFDTAPHLTEPPARYDSVVGVASSAEEPTVFGSEEVREDGAVGSSIDRVTSCHSQLWLWYWFFWIGRSLCTGKSSSGWSTSSSSTWLPMLHALPFSGWRQSWRVPQQPRQPRGWRIKALGASTRGGCAAVFCVVAVFAP